MSACNQQYRLLNVGEKIQEGDEHLCDNGITGQDVWEQVSGGFIGCTIHKFHRPYRRPIPPQGWIPIAERKPETPCVFGRDEKGMWVVSLSAEMFCRWTHWHPLSAPPPKPDPDEQAFEEFWKEDIKRAFDVPEVSLESIRKDVFRSFMAGVEHGRKGAK